MPKRPPHLTIEQKAKLKLLEPRLREAARRGDYETAKKIAVDLQKLLRPTGHHTRLMQSKNWVFEAAMEAGKIGVAVTGLSGVRQIMSSNTRVYLEATALLAICHLRLKEIDEAEPLMAEALRNVGVIRTERRQIQFRRRLIQRFEEEAIISALTGKDKVELDAAQIQKDAGNLVGSKTEDQILSDIGAAIPRDVIALLLRVNEFSRAQLPQNEQKLLPAARQVTNKIELGRTVLRGLTHVAWKSLCDPKNEIHKLWYDQGLKGLLNRGVLGVAVAEAFNGMRIGGYILAAAVAALIIKVGIDELCEKWRPEGVMIDKSER